MDTLQIKITVNKKTDEIIVSKCLDPEFDLDVLTEALASLIMVNSKYTERVSEKVLEDVHSKLKSAILFHGKITKTEKTE